MSRPTAWLWPAIGVVLIASASWMLWTGLSVPDQSVPEPSPFTAAPSPSRRAPHASTMAADTLTIPDLKITADLVPGRVAADTLQIPSDPAKATLWTDGGQPCGTEGTVLIAGHVISYGTEGALWSLHQVRPGAQAFVTCSDGTVTSWYAVSAETLPKDELPPALFQRKGHRQLVVVTCGGPLLKTGHYRDNVIVRFEPLT